MAKSSSASDNKKQATPSQKRLSKQQQQQQQQQHQQQQLSNRPAAPSTSKAPSSGKTRDLDAKVGELTDKNESCREKLSARLVEFSERAGQIKADISQALDRQAKWAEEGDRAASERTVRELHERLAELTTGDNEEVAQEIGNGAEPEPETSCESSSSQLEAVACRGSQNATPPAQTAADGPNPCGQPRAVSNEIEPSSVGEPAEPTEEPLARKEPTTTKSNWFEPLTARLDPKSKFLTLKSSLERNFSGSPELIDSVCHKLVNLSHQIEQLKLQNEHQQREISKLRLIKERLGDLCRELQKSNNQIRIESLDLIRGEQHKAKEQADKIQTTLAGVMKLFDENQQRNSNLKQENFDLQNKLKMLLKHCENWEQCVETSIKQRDIENRLIKTEIARMTLARAEEQERFLKEKQQLLKAIETMRQHQSRVEDKEAKLRSDLSNYASKYDQCQDMIQNGLGKFQQESKRMLSQIERSRQDYVTLLGKYEASNKKIKQLLEEKQKWMTSTAQGNKKLEALEKLCRRLKGENDRLTRAAEVEQAGQLEGGA